MAPPGEPDHGRHRQGHRREGDPVGGSRGQPQDGADRDQDGGDDHAKDGTTRQDGQASGWTWQGLRGCGAHKWG